MFKVIEYILKFGLQAAYKVFPPKLVREASKRMAERQIKSLGEAVGEGLGEKYAHLATGIEYVLSDGTTFDFKNSSFEDLNQLRKERTAMLMKGDFGDKNSAISSAVNDYENAAQKSGKVGDFWNLAKSSYDQANLFFNPIPSSNGSADTEPDLTSKVTTYDWEGGE